MLDDVVVLRRFVQRRRQFHSFVKQVDQVGKGVAEEPADADGDIDARAAQLLQRDDLQAHNPAALGLPSGTNAQQVQDLGNVVAMGAHRRGAPYHQAHHLGVGPLILQVLVQKGLGQLFSSLPRGRRRDGLGVDRVEVPAGGQDVGHSAGRCATGTGRHILSVQSP